MNRHGQSFVAVFLLFLITLLVGCGGGGTAATEPAAPAAPATSTLITGTAAAGAPVVGYVSVRDASANPQPVRTNIAIAADGKYTVDVNGLTPPFAFLASGDVGGRRVELYSAATKVDVGGTINITPFTDLIVRNVAGTVAGTLVDAFLAAGKLTSLTAAQVDAERVKLTALLSPVLQAAGLATSIDLMRASFNADGTGLDRFMDLVKVDTSVPTAVTITNILDAANKLTVNPQAGTTSGGTTLSATGVTSTPTAVDLIRQTFATFSGFFATALPDPATPGLTALFATSFMENGNTKSDFLAEITSEPELKGLKFGETGLVVDSVDSVTGTAKVSFVPLSATGQRLADDMQGGAIRWQMKRVGTAWLFDGNQRIADVRVRAAAGRIVCGVGSSVGCANRAASGLELVVQNHSQRAIGSALVTGPGLPDAGVTLFAQPNSTSFRLNSKPAPGSSALIISNALYEMSDASIGALGANGSYTVALYSNDATPVLLATYTEIVRAAPVLNAALAALAFPELGGQTSLLAFPGGTLLPTWTVPAGLSGNSTNVYVNQFGLGGIVDSQFVDYNLSGQAATGTANMVITPPATGVWSGGGYWIQAWDANGGVVFSNYLYF